MTFNLTRKNLRLSAKRYSRKKKFIKKRIIFAETSSNRLTFPNSRFVINKSKKFAASECANAAIDNSNNKNNQEQQISDCSNTDILEKSKILGLKIVQEHSYSKQIFQLEVTQSSTVENAFPQNNFNELDHVDESTEIETIDEGNYNEKNENTPVSDPQNTKELHSIDKIAVEVTSSKENDSKENYVEPKNEELPELIVEKEVTFTNSEECVDPGERCIIQNVYFINEMRSIFSSDVHKPFNCSADNVELTGQKKYGFRKTFFFKCNMCNKTFKAHTEPKESKFLDVNTCMVAGVKSAGLNYIELKEITAFSGIKCMSDKTYEKISVTLDDNYAKIAQNEINKAGAEERKIAEEFNPKEGDHYTCSLMVDGSWTMRCYGTQGRSKTGAAVGIGQKSQKKHRCYANWDKDKSSSSMESDIITEGFQNSIKDHNLLYTELIGDNDSSTYLKVLQANPYPTVFVKKNQLR
ncbi:Protein of unknown function [Cotesia congregata]|uniref:Mutator-like transposase domain-containing protein n=1 Tax=Cotesia congregata TaxID=51543 RepID=A0A8J2HNN7_COTCN|nr:Protein of unknown function [Cotesia congregata]